MVFYVKKLDSTGLSTCLSTDIVNKLSVSQNWQYEEIIKKWFIKVCRDSAAMNIAATLLEQATIKRSYSATSPAGLDVHATAFSLHLGG